MTQRANLLKFYRARTKVNLSDYRGPPLPKLTGSRLTWAADIRADRVAIAQKVFACWRGLSRHRDAPKQWHKTKKAWAELVQTKIEADWWINRGQLTWEEILERRDR